MKIKITAKYTTELMNPILKGGKFLQELAFVT